jgi:UDP-2-acetamido-2-deoxy-ribo-hexuluronate aminotransferase
MDYIDLKAQCEASRKRIQGRIQQVLDHGRYVLGPEVAELEAQVAHYTGARHCIALGSGTQALVAALAALDIGPGDEVLTTPFGSAAAVEAIARVGARAVFVDLDRATCNIDAGSVDAVVTARTRAVIPVALYGQPADMDELNGISRRRGLAVIEDASQSFGAHYHERKSGNLSLIGCTSFFPGRPLGCYGDGGALLTSDDALAERVHALRERLAPDDGDGIVVQPMDTLQCAIVLAKLERYEWELAQRQRAAASYDALLSGRLQLVGRRRDRSSTFAQYPVILEQRARVRAALLAAGVPATVPDLLPRQLQADGWRQLAASCPVALALAEQVLSLPIGPYLDDIGARRIGELLLRAVGAALPARADALPAHS